MGLGVGHELIALIAEFRDGIRDRVVQTSVARTELVDLDHRIKLERPVRYGLARSPRREEKRNAVCPLLGEYVRRGPLGDLRPAPVDQLMPVGDEKVMQRRILPLPTGRLPHFRLR